MDVLERWNRPIQSLIKGISTLRSSYESAYDRLSDDLKEKFEEHTDYLNSRGPGVLYRLMDYVLCMFPYRDLQYGFGYKHKDTEDLKLGWIAFHIAALENCQKNKGELEKELEKSVQFEGEKERHIKFFINYLPGTIAELSALYVYLINKRIVLPFGFMQHAIQLKGRSGPALGDFIESDTNTFIDVKSRYGGRYFPKKLVNLAISTGVRSAFVVPRYGLRKDNVDNTQIVLDKFEPAYIPPKLRFPQMKITRAYLSADIKHEHKELISFIKLLEFNAQKLLDRMRERA